MDFLNEIWLQIAAYVNVPYLLTFMLLAYLLKRYFGLLLLQLMPQWKTVYTVVLLATLVAIPYLIWVDVSWEKILFSYALGTSMYELIFKWLDKK